MLSAEVMVREDAHFVGTRACKTVATGHVIRSMRLREIPVTIGIEENHRRVSRSIDRAVLKSFSLSGDESEQVFVQISTELATITDDPWEQLEIKRRLAEARISIFFDKNDGLPWFERAWSELEKIGYSSQEREASALWYRAKSLLLQNQQAEADRIVARLDGLIVAIEDSGTASHFRQAVANLRAR